MWDSPHLSQDTYQRHSTQQHSCLGLPLLDQDTSRQQSMLHIEIIARVCSHNEKSADDNRETGRESRVVTSLLAEEQEEGS